MDKFRDVAYLAALEAGKIHKKYFLRVGKIKTKRDSFNYLTKCDLEAEKAIVKVIKRYFPTHNIIGEEYDYRTTKSSYTWIIDPLDGTNNFAHNLPIFCVSIALAKNDEVILGVIYDVMREELFFGEKGRGAYLNDKKIRVDKAERLSEALLITGFYYNRGKLMKKNLFHIKSFFEKKIVGIRRLGAAALDLCYVACGRASGFWEFELACWDFCAGMLLIEEAGGKVTDDKGSLVNFRKASYIVASNGLIHAQILKVLNKNK